MLTTFHHNSYILEALNKYGVEYLVIGGLAVFYYCSCREVDDLDLLISPMPENAKKVEAALVSLGLQSSEYSKLTKPKIQIPLKQHHYTDIVTPEEGFDFKSTYSNSNLSEVNGISVFIISKPDLKKLKFTNRVKDRRDLALLCNKSTLHQHI